MIKYLIILFSLISLTASAQEQDLVKYLNVLKAAGAERAQTVIADYSFDKKADYTIADYSKLTGESFDTDIPAIKGYKASGDCKIKKNDGSIEDKKMMVVMYFDKTKNHWSVYSLRTIADTKQEYESSKNEVEAGKFYTSKEFVYKNLAYWSLMSGHLQDAKKYIDLGIEAAKQTTSSTPFTTGQIDVVLKRIM